MYIGIGLGINPTRKQEGNWSPILSSPVKAWYDPTDPSTITESGGAVSEWKDKSGNGYHLTQATPANRPVTGTRTVGGKNVIDFDRASNHNLYNDTLGSLFSGLHKSHSTYSLLKTDIASTVQWIFCYEKIGDANPADFIGLNATNTLQNFKRDDLTASIAKLSVNTTPQEPTISGFIFDGVNTTIRRDGSTDSVQNSSSGLSTITIDRFRVGNAYGTLQTFDGVIGDIIITDGTETTAERQLLEGFIAWKYGKQALLPVDHPYRFDGRRFGGVKLWNPVTELGSALKAWYNPQTGITNAGSGAVSSWLDNSGNAYSASQGTGSRRPVTGTRTINGQNVLDYNRANSHCLKATGLTEFNGIGKTHSRYLVCQSDLASTLQWITTLEDNAGSVAGSIFGLTAADKLNLFKRDNASNTLNPTGTSAFTTTVANILSSKFNGTNGLSYINGVLDSTLDISTGIGTSTLDALSIGNYETSANGFDGLIGDVIYTDGTETTEQQQKLEGLLAHIYGLTANLPVDHPYKTEPPLG